MTLAPVAWLFVFASGALVAALVTWLALRPRRVEHCLETRRVTRSTVRLLPRVYDWEGEG